MLGSIEMDNSDLYSLYNSMQREDAINVLDEFGPHITWSCDEEQVLDVGCGPGDVSNDILLPRLPTYTSLVSLWAT